MDMRLEVVIVPVSDVDRSKAFYEQVGFTIDKDFSTSDDFRVVHMLPKGSACAITIGKGITPSEPGSAKGLHLVVADLDRALAELAERGVEVGKPFHFGAEGRSDGLHPTRESYGSFAELSDPDGNLYLLQEVSEHSR